MPIPAFEESGDLPPGIHFATLEEVLERFGGESRARKEATAKLLRILRLTRQSGLVDRFVVFGSYVTDKAGPRDIDIVLVLKDNLDANALDPEMRLLLDHEKADAEFGASVFWIRPGLLIDETVDNFVRYWQTKRDKSFRGIVEILM